MELQSFAAGFQTSALKSLGEALDKTGRAGCSGAAGSLDAIILSKFHTAGRTLLIVCETESAAERLEGDLSVLLPELEILRFPAYDTTPADKRLPHGRIVEDRIRVFESLHGEARRSLVTSFPALLMKTVSPEGYRGNTLDLRRGDTMPLTLFTDWLAESGFSRVPILKDLGQFSVRGGIVDLFPYLNENPLRIEFWGDTVDSIRRFDIFSQRSVEKLDLARIVPLRETTPKTPEIRAAGLEWRPAEWREKSGTLFDYLRGEWTLALCETAPVEKHFEACPDPAAFMPREVWPVESGKRPHLSLHAFHTEGDIPLGARPEPRFQTAESSFFKEFHRLAGEGYRLFVLCENRGQRKRFDELALEEEAPVKTILGSLDEGFLLPEEKIALFSENRLFSRNVRRARFQKFRGGTTLHHVSSLQSGDLVVHVDYGIGKFLGLDRVTLPRLEIDCIKIEYRDGDTVSLPVEDLKKVQKYSAGDGEAGPELSPMGGKNWERAKIRAKEEIEKVVHKFALLYGERKHFPRPAFPADSAWQREFEEAFIYEATPDQLKSTEDIKSDLTRPFPMDRLLCGDVGFGKTEVAMRAAFKVVEAGRQVCVLVPTTLLAYQHLRSFSERFRDYPVKIAMVSRFVNAKETESVLSGLKSGTVNVIVGTHRLLSKDIVFNDLGLLVVDEEHRFGVGHKERIKEMKSLVDVLALTATPIPRTLQLSLMGARDLSIIHTPPQNRQPIQTLVAETDQRLVTEAVLREKARGGQVYFVYNQVRSMDLMAEKLKEWLPGISIEHAHGQMVEEDLTGVMRRFIDGEVDLLICSTIIESGLDIPNVNTLIVWEADHFGLSQLYQLRGRVGRSSEKAYALFLVKSLSAMTGEARRRLKTLEQFTELGSGFQVAMRDLEIRGAGNLLGTRQHGLIELVGFEMYNELLKEAIEEIKEQKKTVRPDPEMKFEAKAFIPESYIPDPAQRIEMYHRLSRVESMEEDASLAEEMRDRFGPLPPETGALLEVIAVKRLAGRTGAAGVTVRGGRLTLTFDREEISNPTDLKNLIAKLPDGFQIEDGPKVSIHLLLQGGPELTAAKNVLLKLS